MPLAPGDKLGPYEILGLLGAGGMGEVYRALDPRLHREVAIKIAMDQFTERSAREARLVAALNHPNICHIYDVGPDYMVMELVEGQTLAERLRQGPVPFEEALAIAGQIADALDAAHEKGIVHRDLKPANVKVRSDGTVKVLDFGLAKGAEVTAPSGNAEESPTVTLELATRTGTILGTAGYMAPEQARGKPVDKRADIWAYGVVLYEMLTGARLFQRETIPDTLAAVLTLEPEWNRVPPVTERMLRRCLEKDPKQRLRDIGEARFLLNENHPYSAQPAKNKLPWILNAGALAFALASIIALAWLWISTRRAPPPVLRLNVDLGEDASVRPARGATMALSPDGSRLVFVTGQPFVKSRLAVRRLDQSKALPLSGTDGAEAPFFSPDGKWIAFFAGGKLKKLDAGGGEPVTLCDAPSSREGSWGDDDRIVLAATNLGGLSRIHSSGGALQVVTELDRNRGEETHRYPQVLPGSGAVLFLNSPNFLTGEGSIDVYSFKTGRRKTLIQTGGYGRFLPSGHLVYMHRGILYAAPMDADRLELTGPSLPLVEDVAFEPGTGAAAYTFSQSGVFVYATVNPEDQLRQIAMIDERGTPEPLPVAKARYAHPRVSPDGTRLAVVIEEGSSAGIWIYEWANNRFSRLPGSNGSSTSPLWSPDGKHLIFFTSDTSGPGPGIYSIRTDGTGTSQRLVEGTDLVPSSLLPNASRLAYEVLRGPKRGMWALPLDWKEVAGPKPGTAERLLNQSAGTSYSPDGKWVAFEGAQSGTPEIFVQPAAGPGGPWQVSAGGLLPVWARSGRRLFYGNVPDNRIMVASYSITGDSFSPAPPVPWSDTPVILNGFDPMPDGKRVVAIPGTGPKATHATFMLNFIEDLRRRLPVGK